MISIGGLKHAELVAPPDELQPAELVGAHGTQSDGLQPTLLVRVHLEVPPARHADHFETFLKSKLIARFVLLCVCVCVCVYVD